MNTLYNKSLSFFRDILILVFLAYTLNIFLYFYLPKVKPLMETDKESQLEYIRYETKVAFQNSQKKVKKEKKILTKQNTQYELLSNIALIAIFDLGDGKGVITISQKSKRDTVILGIGEVFEGYTLKEVYRDYVIFEKSNKQYRVELNLEKIPKFTTSKQNEEPQKEIAKNIQFIDDTYQVKRDYLNSYVNDFSKIWKDINIVDYKRKGKIAGFKIKYIKPKSVFETLGLKKGDIIKKVNNIELKSYNDAFKLYNKIDKTKSLNIVIQRSNQEMEINYEIQ